MNHLEIIEHQNGRPGISEKALELRFQRRRQHGSPRVIQYVARGQTTF